MAKNAEKMFDELKQEIENPFTIKSMSSVLPSSPYPDCEAHFMIYIHGKGDRSVHMSSARKANKIKALIGDWIAQSKR
jgi:hypothetical protein